MNESGSYYQSEAEKYFQDAYREQMQGRILEAVGLYKKSIELFPTAEAHTFLGWAYSFQGRYDDAIEECERAITIDPDFGNPYNDIGAYLIEKNKLNEAIPWLEKAIQAKRYDSYCFPHYNLGRVYEQQGNWWRAYEAYHNALTCSPEYTLAKKAMSRMAGMMN